MVYRDVYLLATQKKALMNARNSDGEGEEEVKFRSYKFDNETGTEKSTRSQLWTLLKANWKLLPARKHHKFENMRQIATVILLLGLSTLVSKTFNWVKRPRWWSDLNLENRSRRGPSRTKTSIARSVRSSWRLIHLNCLRGCRQSENHMGRGRLEIYQHVRTSTIFSSTFSTHCRHRRKTICEGHVKGSFRASRLFELASYEIEINKLNLFVIDSGWVLCLPRQWRVRVSNVSGCWMIRTCIVLCCRLSSKLSSAGTWDMSKLYHEAHLIAAGNAKSNWSFKLKITAWCSIDTVRYYDVTSKLLIFINWTLP